MFAASPVSEFASINSEAELTVNSPDSIIFPAANESREYVPPSAPAARCFAGKKKLTLCLYFGVRLLFSIWMDR